MSTSQNESLTATHRRLSLTTPITFMPTVIEEQDSDNAEQDDRAGASDVSQTMYLAFETPIDIPTEATDIAPTSDPTDLAALVQAQSLELAANRAELARQKREQEDLQRAVRLRDGWLQDLRSELKLSQEDRRVLTAQLSDAQANLRKLDARVGEQDAKLKQLEADAAERMGKTIFASERVSPIAPPPSEAIALENPSKLLPLDGDTTPIRLDRKVMTVGRTRDNHVFVHSQLVSRDHARIIVSEENVVVFDIGSANGCFVNDEQIRRRTLADGDIVRFADRGYRFCA
jgi:hypothetical protein